MYFILRAFYLHLFFSHFKITIMLNELFGLCCYLSDEPFEIDVWIEAYSWFPELQCLGIGKFDWDTQECRLVFRVKDGETFYGEEMKKLRLISISQEDLRKKYYI
jgi:hypothetical protein